jgi:hypothetical protein
LLFKLLTKCKLRTVKNRENIAKFSQIANCEQSQIANCEKIVKYVQIANREKIPNCAQIAKCEKSKIENCKKKGKMRANRTLRKTWGLIMGRYKRETGTKRDNEKTKTQNKMFVRWKIARQTRVKMWGRNKLETGSERNSENTKNPKKLIARWKSRDRISRDRKSRDRHRARY